MTDPWTFLAVFIPGMLLGGAAVALGVYIAHREARRRKA